jgi:hypothetical protein
MKELLTIRWNEGTKSTTRRWNVKDIISSSKAKHKGQNMQHEWKKTREGIGNSKAKWKNTECEEAMLKNDEERKEGGKI